MLSGRTPHHEAESTGQLLVMICTDEPEPIERAAPWVPPALAKVLGRALQRKPEDRFASIQELHDALLPFADGMVELRADEIVGVPNRVRLAARRQQRDQDNIDTLTSSQALVAKREGRAAGLEHEDSGTLASGTVRSEATPHRSRGRVLVATAAAVVAVVVAIVGWRALSRVAPAADPGAAELDATAEPTGDATASVRTVRLAVSPEQVEVTVNGEAALVVDGGVELSGPVGSTHQVQLTDGEQSTEHTIAITEAGALPERLELAPAASASATVTTAEPTPVVRKPRPATGTGPGKPKPTAAPQATTAASAPAGTSKWSDQLSPSTSLE
jgi:serine/threonine-protein kinase